MTIQKFPDNSNINYGYFIPTSKVFPFNYSVGRGDRGILTVARPVPAGIYECFANGTNGTIFVPNSNGTSATLSGGNSGNSFPVTLRVLTSATQFQVSVPTRWNQNTFSAGTTMFMRFIIGANNRAVHLATFSTSNSAYRIYTSTDYFSWTEQTNPGGSISPGGGVTPGSGIHNIYPAAFGNGWFVVATNSTNPRLLISTNGFTWSTNNGGGVTHLSVNFANGIFFANGENINHFFVSTDLVTWSSRNNAGQAVAMTGTAHNPNNGIYVRVGHSSLIITSTDLLTWTTRTSPISSVEYRGVSFGNGFFVANSGSGTAISTDGITWTTGLQASPTAANNVIFSTSDNMHVFSMQGNATSSIGVIGTSSAGSNSGFGNFDLTTTTAGGITYTGNVYMVGMLAQSGGSNQQGYAFSSTLPGIPANNTQGYIALRGQGVAQ